MDIFFDVIIAGFSVAYLVEILGLILGIVASPKLVKHILTPPLAFIFCWFLDIFNFELVVSGLAASFVATTLRIVIDSITSKPQVVSRNYNRVL